MLFIFITIRETTGKTIPGVLSEQLISTNLNACVKNKNLMHELKSWTKPLNTKA